jgi:ankyrin repeat protein
VVSKELNLEEETLSRILDNEEFLRQYINDSGYLAKDLRAKVQEKISEQAFIIDIVKRYKDKEIDLEEAKPLLYPDTEVAQELVNELRRPFKMEGRPHELIIRYLDALNNKREYFLLALEREGDNNTYFLNPIERRDRDAMIHILDALNHELEHLRAFLKRLEEEPRTLEELAEDEILASLPQAQKNAKNMVTRLLEKPEDLKEFLSLLLEKKNKDPKRFEACVDVFKSELFARYAQEKIEDEELREIFLDLKSCLFFKQKRGNVFITQPDYAPFLSDRVLLHILENGFGFRVKDPEGNTLMHMFAEVKKEKLRPEELEFLKKAVAYCRKHKIPVQPENDQKQTPFIIAVKSQSLGMQQYLKRPGVKVKARHGADGIFEEARAFVAEQYDKALRNYKEVSFEELEYFKKLAEDLNIDSKEILRKFFEEDIIHFSKWTKVKDSKGNNALHRALMKKDKEIVEMILKATPITGLSYANNNKKTPFEIARDSGQHEFLDRLKT